MSAPVTLRCHRCSHFLALSPAPRELVGIFKASRMGRVAQTHVAEVRHRCRSCGWVNVFHPPIEEPRHRQAIEVK